MNQAQLEQAMSRFRSHIGPGVSGWSLKHNCRVNHRTYRAMAKCVWPTAYRIAGEGPWAVVTRCRVLTVDLYEDPYKAWKWGLRLMVYNCGGICPHTTRSENHGVVRLDFGAKVLLSKDAHAELLDMATL